MEDPNNALDSPESRRIKKIEERRKQIEDRKRNISPNSSFEKDNITSPQTREDSNETSPSTLTNSSKEITLEKVDKPSNVIQKQVHLISTSPNSEQKPSPVNKVESLTVSNFLASQARGENLEKIILRVEIEDYEEMKTSKVVSVVFNQFDTIRDALRKIGSKGSIAINPDSADRDFVLYLSSSEGGGLVLTKDRLLSSYNLHNKDTLILKRVDKLQEEDDSKNQSLQPEKRSLFSKLRSSKSLTKTNSAKLIKHSTLNNSPEAALFGVSLQEAISNSSMFGVPTVVEHAIEFLENNALKVKGLFTIPGDQNQINKYREEYDNRRITSISEQENPHDIAALLILFLKQLPEPLLTYQLYDSIISDFIKDSSPNFSWNVKYEVQKLPRDNIILVSRLLDFLGELMEKSSLNGMTYDTLGKIFGPFLLRPHPKIHLTEEEANRNTEIISKILRDFIKDSDILFESPVPKKPPSHPGEVFKHKIAKVYTHFASSIDLMEKLDSQLNLVGFLWLSNYRVIWRQDITSSSNDVEVFSVEIPLTTIKTVKKTGKIKSKEVVGGIYLACKDLRNFVFGFTSSSSFKSSLEFISSFSNPKNLSSTFAFFYQPNFDLLVNGWLLYDVQKEFTRQGISWQKWKISSVNRNFGICESYPPSIIVESSITDDDLIASSKLRIERRFPIYVWGWKNNNAALFRVGIPRYKESEKKRSKESEKKLANLRKTESKLLEVFLHSNSKHGDKLTIFDTGTPQNWHAPLIPIGSFKYKNCPNNNFVEEVFLKMEFTILSPQRASSGSYNQSNWLQAIQTHLSTVATIVTAIQNEESVLLQESPNCDSVFVVSSLAQLCLDPFYRTIEGFAILVEKDWLSLGFPFSKKTGFSSAKKSEKDENVPSFVLFIDCLWQIWYQYPSAFEFNEEFLTFVLRHLYSCRFGTFIGNNEKERFYNLQSKTKTISLWTQIFMEKKRFLNPFYTSESLILTPIYNRIIFFTAYYLWWDQFIMRYQRKIRQFFDKTIQQNSKKLKLNNRQLAVLSNDTHLASLVVFDISENEFTVIPTMVLFLQNLKELYLGNNFIRFISEGFWNLIISRLVFLEQVDIKNNNLTELPDSFGTTKSLRVLYLGGNSISKLPSSFSKLVNLHTLSLPNNKFSQDLSIFSSLPKLETLNLSNSLFSQLTEGLSFPELRILDLSQNSIENFPNIHLPQLVEISLANQKRKIADIPPSFFTYMGHSLLRKVNLKGNSLSELPPTICRFNFLEDLDLEDNKFKEIQPEILSLISLKRLNLRKNDLSSLPNDISKLLALEELLLGTNNLSVIPSAIGKLSKLRTLDISSNQIDSFPPTLALLNLENFDFSKNKLRQIPKSIQTTGTQGIMEYLKDLFKGNEPCYRLKIMIVGQENVGKTTLSSHLRKKQEISTTSTDGIVIEPWPVFSINIEEEGKTKKQPVELTVWDFAGQEIYYATHQFFMSKRSIYILVWNLAKDVSDCKLDFWLHSIKARVKNTPVFVVGTHSDQLPKETAITILASLEHKYKKMFPSLDLFFRYVSCITGEGIQKLRNEIEEIALAQKTMGQRIPVATLSLEKFLLEKANTLVPPIISKKELTDLGQLCNINDPYELSRAAKVLHEFGSIVYFENDPKLCNVIVLRPKWLTEVMATVLTTKHNFAKGGILEHSALLQIWREPAYPKSIHAVLLNILENFEVTFPLEPFNDKYTGKNLLPSLLLSTLPDDFSQRWAPMLPIDLSETGKDYKFDFVPFGLFGRIIVRILRLGIPELFWGNGILLRQDKKLTLIRFYPEYNLIEVRVRSPHKPTVIGRELTESIESLIQHWYKINVQILIPCAHCLETTLIPPYQFPLELCESLAIQGKPFINCERDKLITPVRLDRVVPDLTLKEYEGVKISYDELQIGKELGEGGAAKVYQAKWKNEIVAIKKLKLADEITDSQENFSQKFKEFRREVLIMSALFHPCLVNLKGLVLEPFCIVMEYIPFGDLFKLIQNKDRELDWPLKCKIAVDISSGILYLHSANPPIIHRDLKSVNVMMNSLHPFAEVVAKITDFGLSGAVQTVSNQEVANPRWLAPEIMKKEEFTLASDVYSFGIILWELVSRKLPFEEISFDTKVEEVVLQGKRPEIPSVPIPEYSQLIVDCWHQTPSKRPTFHEIRETLFSIAEKIQQDYKVKFKIHHSMENLLTVKESSQSLNQLDHLHSETFPSTTSIEETNSFDEESEASDKEKNSLSEISLSSSLQTPLSDKERISSVGRPRTSSSPIQIPLISKEKISLNERERSLTIDKQKNSPSQKHNPSPVQIPLPEKESTSSNENSGTIEPPKTSPSGTQTPIQTPSRIQKPNSLQIPLSDKERISSVGRPRTSSSPLQSSLTERFKIFSSEKQTTSPNQTPLNKKPRASSIDKPKPSSPVQIPLNENQK